MGQDGSDYLLADETAIYLRRSIWTLYEWRKRRVGPRAEKIGGLLMYPKTELRRWIDDGGHLDPWDS